MIRLPNSSRFITLLFTFFFTLLFTFFFTLLFTPLFTFGISGDHAVSCARIDFACTSSAVSP